MMLAYGELPAFVKIVFEGGEAHRFEGTLQVAETVLEIVAAIENDIRH